MRYVKLICHQLIGMLAVRLSEVFVQLYAVADGQDRVRSVYSKENDVCEVSGLQNQFTESKQQDESNGYRTDISSEAFGVLPKVEKAKYQQTKPVTYSIDISMKSSRSFR